MTTGVLLFAFDTDTTSYTKIAEFACKQIKSHLNLSVTLVTNNYDNSNNIFDTVILQELPPAQSRTDNINDPTINIQWRNFNRCDAYKLTPYDSTLLLDTDYIVNSKQLLKLFDSTEDILCHSTRSWVGSESLEEYEYFGNTKMTMMWATVVFFRKSELAEAVFDMWQTVQQNYTHYANLYRFDGRQFRNDYALTIAFNTVLGHGRDHNCEIVWKLLNCPRDTLVTKTNNQYRLEFKEYVNKQQKDFNIVLQDLDLHILNKQSVLDMVTQ